MHLGESAAKSERRVRRTVRPTVKAANVYAEPEIRNWDENNWSRRTK